MVDPIFNFLSAIYIIFQNLPAPYLSLIGVAAVLSVVIIIARIVGGL